MRRGRALRRRYGRSDFSSVHEAMARELWKRGKVAVRGEGDRQDFVVIMQRGSRHRPDRVDSEGLGYYAPSLDGKTPETAWQRMNDFRLKAWLANFRPVLRSV